MMNLLAVIELFPTRALGAFCVALGFACVAIALGCAFAKPVKRWASGLTAKFLALSPLNKAVIVLALAVSTVCAQKSGTNEVDRIGVEGEGQGEGEQWNLPTCSAGQPEQESNLLCSPSTFDFDYSTQTVTPDDIARGWQVWEVRTNGTDFAMPANAVRNEDWFRFGGHSMFDFVSFGEGWTFPYGTQELARVTAMEDGGLRVKLSRSEDEIRAVPCLLAAFPRRSQFGHTTNGQNRVFAWQGFFSGGDTGAVVSAQVELRANGDFVTRSNAVETLCRRIEPFDYDGDGIPNDKDARPCFYDGDHYGQSEVWVRANFTNAEEILSVGYRQWVDAQVGVGLANGLYKLTATFPEVPRRTTLLTVGDLSVCVTNAGEYVFLLEKGVEYEFGAVPYDSNVTYSAEDDLPRRWLLGAAEDESGDWSGWTVDWRPLWIELPRIDRIGHLCWLPYFTVTPDICHQGPDEQSQSFCAFFGDYRYGQAARYHWTCEDTNVVFTAADSNETAILLREMPDWHETRIVAHAFFGTNEFTSVAHFHYGRQPKPSVGISFSKKVVFFENSYTNSYGDLVVGRADFVTLNCEVHGGEKGGRVRIELNAQEKIRPIRDVQFPYEDEVDVGEVKFYSFVCLPQVASETLNDVTASVLLTENESSDSFDDVSSTTVIEARSYVSCNWIPYVNRRELGVGEQAVVYTYPSEHEVPLTVDGCTYTNEQWMYFAGERAGMHRVLLNCQGERFWIDFETVEPQLVSALGCYAGSTVESGVVGGLQCDFDLRLFPTNVSFSGVEVSEVAQVATNAVGFFARPELSYLLDHGEHGGGEWHGLRGRNSFSDMARIGAIVMDIGDGGSFTYPIPRAWRVTQTSVTNILPHRVVYDQRFELDANGTIRIRKFGYVSQRTRNGEVTSQKESE